MQILLKGQQEKSTKSHDDNSNFTETYPSFQPQKILETNADRRINQSLAQSSSGTQTKYLQPFNVQRATLDPKKLSNKNEYIQSIRLSYQVLDNGNNLNVQSPDKRKRKLMKKSFHAIQEQDDTETPQTKINELMSPLKIDLKKLDPRMKFVELSEGLESYNGKIWQKTMIDIDFKTQQLIISNLHIPFVTVQKIKIFKPDQIKKLNEIKITYTSYSTQQTIFLNLKQPKSVKKIPVQYVIFQQILTNKLTFQGRFKQTKWQKKPHICEQILFSSYIFGEIYKKSQYFGKWQKRYIVVNGKGIFSYKSWNKKEDYSFFIQRQSIDYMWSRFDLVDGYLVVKIKHGVRQTEFGIPIANYGYAHFKNWLFYFFKLMLPQA